MATKNQETTSTEIFEQKQYPIANAAMFEEDAGAGMEGADSKSFAIPFISLLQGLSPQLETVEGARPGKFINSITNELYDEVQVVPCAFQRQFIRWSPRSTGGGFKGTYSPIEVETGSLQGLSNQGGTYMMDVPEGKQAFDAKGLPLFDHLSDTRNHFVLAKNADGGWTPALVSLSSTQIKKSKRWMSRIQGVQMRRADGSTFTPPSFSHVYKLKAVKEKNAKGEWWGLEVDMVGAVEDGNLYAAAKAFHGSVSAGEVEVAPPPSPADAAGDGEKF